MASQNVGATSRERTTMTMTTEQACIAALLPSLMCFYFSSAALMVRPANRVSSAQTGRWSCWSLSLLALVCVCSLLLQQLVSFRVAVELNPKERWLDKKH